MKMKRYLILMALSLNISINLYAQIETKWEIQFGSEIIARELLSIDENLYVIGSRKDSLNKRKSNIFIGCFDKNGSMIWEKQFPKEHWGIAKNIIKTKDEGYLISSLIRSNNGFEEHNVKFNGVADFLLIKYNKAWELEWIKSYGTKNFESPEGIVQSNNGSIYVAGHTSDDNRRTTKGSLDRNIYVIKVDDKGKLIWEKEYGGKDVEGINSISMWGNELVISGITKSEEIIQNDRKHAGTWIFGIDSEGERLWDDIFGGPLNNLNYELLSFGKGEMIYFNNKYLPSDYRDVSGQHDIKLTLFNSKGDKKQETLIGESDFDEKIIKAKMGKDGEILLLYKTLIPNESKRKISTNYKIGIIKFELKKRIRYSIVWESSNENDFNSVHDFIEYQNGYAVLQNYNLLIYIEK